MRSKAKKNHKHDRKCRKDTSAWNRQKHVRLNQSKSQIHFSFKRADFSNKNIWNTLYLYSLTKCEINKNRPAKK